MGKILSQDKYIKFTNNNTEDALSRILITNSDKKEKDITRENSAVIYFVDILDSDTFYLTYRTKDIYQCKNKNLVGKLDRANYGTKYFRGILNIFVFTCKNDKTFVPNILQKYIVI